MMMLLLPLLVSVVGVDEALVATGVQQYETEIKSAEHLGHSSPSLSKAKTIIIIYPPNGYLYGIGERGNNDSLTLSMGYTIDYPINKATNKNKDTLHTRLLTTRRLMVNAIWYYCVNTCDGSRTTYDSTSGVLHSRGRF
jgi:hypothetical protein